MKGKEKRIVSILLFLMIVALPVRKADASDQKARLLEVLRGDYINNSLDLTPGPENDGKNIARVIGQAYQENLVYSVKKETEGVTTVSGVQQAIQEAFAESQEEDVNYFYYSGHGSTNGMYLESGNIMTAANLATAFANIKGTNIIIMDCCYSGNMVNRVTRSADTTEEAFSERFVREFQEAVDAQTRKSRSALTNSKFKLLVASSEEEVSYQATFTSGDENIELGGFTTTLSYGAGIDPFKVSQSENYILGTASADYDRNGEISMDEMRRYIENTYQYDANHVRVYPDADDSCFLPVEEAAKPKITFKRAFVDDVNKEITVSYSSEKPLPVDYIIYTAPEQIIGNMTVAIYTDTRFPNYSNVTTAASQYGYTLPASEEGSFTIPLKNWTQGNYYILLQGGNQALRYFLPFKIAAQESEALKKNFQVILSGSQFEDQVFHPQNGGELQIRADFGTTSVQDIDRPYVSCSIYKEDGSLVKLLGEKELMEVVGTSTGGGFTTGKCYRSFFWNGTDALGTPVEDGTYLAKVTSEGAVNDTKEIRFSVDSSELIVQAKIKNLSLSKTELTLPTEEEEGITAEFTLDYAGTLSVSVYKGEQEVMKLISESSVSPGTKTVKWNGVTAEKKYAASGTDYAFRILYQPDNDMLPAEEKKSFEVKTLNLEAGIIKYNTNTTVDFSKGETWGCTYSVNYDTYVDAKVYDEDSRVIAHLVDGQVVTQGEHELTWDGKDQQGNLVKDGTYSLWIQAYDTIQNEWVLFSENVVIVAKTRETVDPSTEKPIDPETEKPTEKPTEAPTEKPTEAPTEAPTEKPTEAPTEAPTEKPTEASTEAPTEKPTEKPTEAPTEKPTEAPTEKPTETQTEKPAETKVDVSSIEVRTDGKPAGKLVLGQKEKADLQVTVLPANATDKTITFSSTNTKVATVTSTGRITANAVGNAKILVCSSNQKLKEIQITVKKAPSKISFPTKTKQLKKGKTLRLKVKLPAKTASRKIQYSSNKKSVVTVDASGKIKAWKKGTAYITAKAFNGKKAKIKIVVK